MMNDFTSHRVSQTYTQINNAPPEKVFPLLCPVREAEWAPGWQYRMIYSQSGIAEAGCVFATPNEDGSETIWMVTDYDPAAFGIAFAWVRPGKMTADIRIALAPADETHTRATITYTYTGLSNEGNSQLASYTKEWFAEKMRGWETAINQYLRDRVGQQC